MLQPDTSNTPYPSTPPVSTFNAVTSRAYTTVHR